MSLNLNENQIKAEKLNIFERLLRSALREKAQVLPDNEDEEIQEIIKSINDTKKEWINAVNNFEYADTQELIDYYTYKIKSCEIMYAYLLKKAKEKGIRVEHTSGIQAVCIQDT